jgi:hypothetical protein
MTTSAIRPDWNYRLIRLPRGSAWVCLADARHAFRQ